MKDRCCQTLVVAVVEIRNEWLGGSKPDELSSFLDFKIQSAILNLESFWYPGIKHSTLLVYSLLAC